MFSFFGSKATVKLPDNQEVFRLAVESSTNHIIITDVDGHITFANHAAQKITGYTQAEMLGKTPRLWGGRMPTEFYQKMWQTIKVDQLPFTGELQNVRKNGEVYTAFTRISPIFGQKHQLIGFIGTEEDISQRIAIEREISAKNAIISGEKQKDEAILESIDNGVIATDDHSVILMANPAALNMLGFDKKELIGKKYHEVIHAQDENGQKITASAQRKMVDEVLVFTKKDNTKFTVNTKSSPVFIDKKLFGFVIIFRDVTTERAIDQAKTEFISLASHQLRTPLTTINWYIEMLISGDAGAVNAKQKKFLDEAYKGSLRMVALVNDLLNVSRIESNTYMVNPEPIEVVQVLRTVLDESKLKIDDKRLHVTVEKEEIPIIPLDKSLTTIVFQNLISNAIKYTGTNGHVTISLRMVKHDETIGDTMVGPDNLLIKIADTGLGISKDDQPRIFTKLFRARNIQEKDVVGTGLGLYLIKGLIERSQGKIWFTSEENKGTTFYVTLPLSGMKRRKGTKQLNP